MSSRKQLKFNPIQDRESKKAFLPVFSFNFYEHNNQPPNFLTFSFNPLSTLV